MTAPQTLYRFESDPCIIINLSTPDRSLLTERRQTLEAQLARITTDISVLTQAIENVTQGEV